jgi:glycosyltransferase involved in cell wall biosynthesis
MTGQKRRILQMLPSLWRGDAIGNEVLAIHRALREQGYDTKIYYLQSDGSIPAEDAQPVSELPGTSPEDVILYHLSIGSALNDRIRTMPGHKVFRYHNITPAYFFRGYNPKMGNKCRLGLEEIKSLRDVPESVIAVSEFNKQDLISYGYKCPISVCPIVIRWEDYAIPEGAGQSGFSGTPDAAKAEPGRGKNAAARILFVGRISPNKCHEDLIAATAAYVAKYDGNVTLRLVGSDAGNERYTAELKRYAKLLGIAEKVIFTGPVGFAGIVEEYRAADLFLCLSEHEGFCVPLVEAMHFGVPIVAYDAAAVKETLGNAGILLTDKAPELVADAMHKQLLQPEDFRAAEAKRVADFAQEVTLKRLLELLEPAMQG